MDANEVEKLTVEDITVLSERIKSILVQAEAEYQKDENGKTVSEVDTYSIANHLITDILLQISHNFYEAIGVIEVVKDDIKRIWDEGEQGPDDSECNCDDCCEGEFDEDEENFNI